MKTCGGMSYGTPQLLILAFSKGYPLFINDSTHTKSTILYYLHPFKGKVHPKIKTQSSSSYLWAGWKVMRHFVVHITLSSFTATLGLYRMCVFFGCFKPSLHLFQLFKRML